jgi:hypothetical protein
MSLLKKIFGGASKKQALIDELYLAAKTGNSKEVQALLGKRADVNAKDKAGKTALMFASLMWGQEIVQTLLAGGADANAMDMHGKTALMFASKNGGKETVQALLAKGADVNAKDDGGTTPLMYALSGGIRNREVILTLLAQEADVNAKELNGTTPLIYAAMIGNKELMQALLDKGGDLDAKDNDGRTALMWADKNGHRDVVQWLFAMAKKEATKLFTDNGDGTVTNHEVGLMWQKDDDGHQRNWKEAMEYARALSLAGHSDWRLPSKDELVSLSCDARPNSEIRRKYFPGMKASDYWTSTTYENNDGDAYYVTCDGGNPYSGEVSYSYSYKTYTHYVRCVRM